MMKIFAIIFTVSLPACSLASSVLWDFVSGRQDSDRMEIETTVKQGLPVSLFFSVHEESGTARLFDAACNLATMATFMLASESCRLDGSVFGNGMSSFYSTEYAGATGRIYVSPDEPFFIGFQAYETIVVYNPATGIYDDTKGIAYYGWLKFEWLSESELQLVSSAIDLDGDAIYVGGGSAVPEPSAGLLVLAGLAALVLRRRRSLSPGDEGAEPIDTPASRVGCLNKP